MRPGGRGRSLGRRRRRREAGAPWGPVRVYTAAGGCGRGTRRSGGTMVMAHFVENFWVSGRCWGRRGLQLLLAACVRGGRRLLWRPSESPRPGVARPSSRGPWLSGHGHRVLRVGNCSGRPGWQRCPGAAAGTPRAGGAGRGQSADGACAASGAGSRAPGGSASRGAGPGPRAESGHGRTGSALPLGRAAGLVGLRPGLCLQACSQSLWKLDFVDLPSSPLTPVFSPSAFVQLLLAGNGKYASATHRKVMCSLRYLGRTWFSWPNSCRHGTLIFGKV